MRRCPRHKEPYAAISQQENVRLRRLRLERLVQLARDFLVNRPGPYAFRRCGGISFRPIERARLARRLEPLQVLVRTCAGSEAHAESDGADATPSSKRVSQRHRSKKPSKGLRHRRSDG